MATAYETEIAQRVRSARVIATVVGVYVLVQMIDATPDAADGVPVWWKFPVVLLAGGALVLLWRRDPPWRLVAVMLLVAVLAMAFVHFGDGEFARTLTFAVAAAIALYIVGCYLLYPLVAWRKARWPAASPMPFVPIEGELTDVPEFLAERVRSLVALGFVPRATLAHNDREGRADYVCFVHATQAILALSGRVSVMHHHYDCTQLSAVPSVASGTRLTVVDALVPDPFPPDPADRALVFPGRTPDALLAIVHRLQPIVLDTLRVPSAAELIALIASVPDKRMAWLIGQGYLDPRIIDGAHRFTLKGGFVAAWRLLWPGSAIIRALRRREAEAALQSAPPA